MNEFKRLHKQEFENNSKLARALRDIGLDLCNQKEIEVNEIIYEQVTLENETWININFEIDCKNPTTLAEMNFELSKKLSNNQDLINSDMQFIPSFIAGEKKHGCKFQGIPYVR